MPDINITLNLQLRGKIKGELDLTRFNKDLGWIIRWLVNKLNETEYMEFNLEDCDGSIQFQLK